MLALSDLEQILASSAAALVAGVVGGWIGGGLGARREITTATRKRQQEVLVAMASNLPDIDAVAFGLNPETIDDESIDGVIRLLDDLRERWEKDWRESVADEEVHKRFLFMQVDGRALRDYLGILKRFGRNPSTIETMTEATRRFRDDMRLLREYLERRIHD